MSSWLSQKQNNILVVTLLIVFFLPTQLGYHIWPSFAVISGLRIDYLSPTLYVTDLLLLLLLSLTFFSKKEIDAQSSKLFFLSPLPFLFFWLFIFFNVLLSQEPLVSFLFLLRICMISYFSYSLAFLLRTHASQTLFALAVAASIFVQTIFVLSQYIRQASVGSLGYLLGERTFSVLTPGIATVIVHGEKLLRPYGTFSHPNVLGGYSVLGFFLLLAYVLSRNPIDRRVRVVLFVAMGCAVCLLFLSMSRLAILTWCLGLIALFMQTKRPIRKWIILATVGIGVTLYALTPLLARFHNLLQDEAIISRGMQISLASEMIKHYGVFGSGLNTYILLIPEFYKGVITPGILQPVHNVILLLLVEVGGIGIIVLLIGIMRLLDHTKWLYKKTQFPYPLFVAILLLLSLGDHYLVTSQQGRLLVGVIVGVLYSFPLAEAKKFSNLHRNRS